MRLSTTVVPADAALSGAVAFLASGGRVLLILLSIVIINIK